MAVFTENRRQAVETKRSRTGGSQHALSRRRLGPDAGENIAPRQRGPALTQMNLARIFHQGQAFV